MKKIKEKLPFLLSIGGLMIISGILAYNSASVVDNYIKDQGTFIKILFTISLMLLALGMGVVIQTIFHELGHLIFGLITKYKFLFFRVGNLTLINENGNLKLKKFNIPGTLGQCLMAPPKFKRGKYPFMLFNLGGVIINVFLGITFFLISPYLDKSIFSIFLLGTGLMGIYLGITNAIPLEGVPTDGTNIKAIRDSYDGKMAFHSTLQVAEMRLIDEKDDWKIKSLVDKSKYNDYKNRLVVGLFTENIDMALLKGDIPEALKEIKWVLNKNVLSAIELAGIYYNLFSIYLLLGDDKNIKRYLERKDIKDVLKKPTTKEGERVKYLYYSLYEKDEKKRDKALKNYNRMAENHLFKYTVRIDKMFIDLADERVNWENEQIVVESDPRYIKIPSEKKSVFSKIDENGKEGIYLKFRIDNKDIPKRYIVPIGTVLIVESLFKSLKKKTKIKWLNEIHFLDSVVGSAEFIEEDKKRYLYLKLRVTSDSKKLGYIKLKNEPDFASKIMFYLMSDLYAVDEEADIDSFFLRYNKYLYRRNQFITIERRGEILDVVFSGVTKNLDMIGEMDGDVKKFKYNDVKIIK